MANTNTTLLNIFGAKLSKDGTKVILVLVAGDADNRRYYNACIPLGKEHKYMAEVAKGEYGNYAMFSVKMLEDKPIKTEPLPF